LLMRVKCLFFAESRARTRLGDKEFFLEEGNTTKELTQKILQEFPSLSDILNRCIFAVNQEYLGENPVILKEGDEIAIIPPLSGG